MLPPGHKHVAIMGKNNKENAAGNYSRYRSMGDQEIEEKKGKGTL
jgi:hypothetical protein